MIRFCSLIMLLLLGITAGCSTTGDYVHDLSINDSGRTLELVPGDTIRIVLESNPSTGYFWDEDGKPDTDVIRLSSKQFLPAPRKNNMTGVPRKQEFLYKVVGSGEAGIRLSHKRPWETGLPVATFQLKIKVDATLNSFMDRFDRSKEPLRRVDSKGNVAPPLSEDYHQ